MRPATKRKPKRPAAASEVLREAIAASDLSVYEIARRAGVSAIAVSRFVRGERDIRLATADKLFAALNLKVARHAKA